jgi:hypothetical protein
MSCFWHPTPIASDPRAYGRPLFFCSTTTNPRMEWFYVGYSVVKAERTRVGRDRRSEPGPNANNDGRRSPRWQRSVTAFSGAGVKFPVTQPSRFRDKDDKYDSSQVLAL